MFSVPPAEDGKGMLAEVILKRQEAEKLRAEGRWEDGKTFDEHLGGNMGQNPGF
jgi:hypothetical protein